jgi:hypothetical protein
MATLKRAVDELDELRYSELLSAEIFDSEEVLMLAYCAVVCFNSEQAFDILLRRNNRFQLKPRWHALFNKPRIFHLLKNGATPERRQLDLITLSVAFERDIYFMGELVLERAS